MAATPLDTRLKELNAKQQKIDQAWKQSGNSQLLDYFVEIIPLTVNAERCSIFVLDASTNSVWLKCGTGLAERQVSVPKNESMVEQVIASGHFQIEDNMENRVGSHEFVDMKTGFISRSALCVPIKGICVDKVIGAVQVLNKKDLKSFNDQDIDILQKLAFQIGSSIETAFLKKQWVNISVEMNKTINELKAKLG